MSRRGTKIYVDSGQTGRGRAIVSPYSVRAVRGARVSTPLAWDEVHAALDEFLAGGLRLREDAGELEEAAF